MKKALVLSLLILSLGVAAFGAGSFSGSWNTDLWLSWDGAGAVTLDSLYSLVMLDYTIGGWTFGSNVVFDLDGISYLWFDAGGAIGAFSFSSFLEFDPTASTFVTWENVAEISLGGMDLYGLFSIAQDGGDVGVGWAFGGIGEAGPATFGVEVDFGAGGGLYFAKLYGVMGAYGPSDGWTPCTGPSRYYYTNAGLFIGEYTCTQGFTGADIFVSWPFTCLDVTAFLSFSCDVGFSSLTFLFENVDLGIGWINIDSMSIEFQTGSKSICADFDLTFGDAVCVTPYLELVQDVTAGGAYLFDGIELNALMLNYNYNGVTFKAGEIFDNRWERESGWINTYTMCDSMEYSWYFSYTGDITRYTCSAFRLYDEVAEEYIYPNEFFGLSIDGDSCCGGAYNVDIYNFFVAGGDPGEYGIFGWLGTYGGIELGIGSNTTISFGAIISYLGFEELHFDFGFTW